MSADGRWVVFSSLATNILNGITDTNAGNDLFLFDASTATTTLISRASTGTATTNGESVFGAQSEDGNWVVFETFGTNLVAGVTDTNAQPDVYRFDRNLAVLTLASHAAGAATTTGNQGSRAPFVSADGRYLAYSSIATNLGTGITDGNNDFDAWIFDAASGANTLLSLSQSNQNQTASAGSVVTAISSDGSFVALRSLAGNLAQDFDLNSAQDAFVHHVPSRTNKLMSRRAGTNGRQPPFSGASLSTLMSADAGTFLMTSASTELVSGINDGNGVDDLFVARDAAVVLTDSFE
ncbi:MAG: PD40 domain-containing protein [Ahniella sp.]|nr:PD40 domain-containing protein [Ahniella sp.]